MTALENWLNKATRSLSKDSVAQVRTEIQDHYESARETAMRAGANDAAADHAAMSALGDAKTANCQHRKVLLTSTEARLLREGSCEARAIGARPWLKRLMIGIPMVVLSSATAFYLAGVTEVARMLLLASIAAGLFLAVPFLPVYTPSRSRAYRAVKWVALTVILIGAFGRDAVWMLSVCAWPLLWIELTRVSIRRKLPVAQWPKQLYL